MLMVGSVVVLAGFTALVIVGVMIRTYCHHCRLSLVEQAFDAARAQDDWPTPEELFDVFAIAADGSSEAELKRLADQLSDFTRRLERMKRLTKEGVKT